MHMAVVTAAKIVKHIILVFCFQLKYDIDM